MYIILFLLLASSNVFAKDIEIQIDRLKYNINYNKDSVIYTGSLAELSLNSRPCNKHIIDKLNLLMDKVLSEKLSTKSDTDSMKIMIDKKDFYEPKTTTRAIFFKNFDKFFKQLKTEEYVNCED